MAELIETLDVEAYRRRLAIRETALQALLARAEQAVQDHGDTQSSEERTATAGAASLIARYREELSRVRIALDAIDAGTFGVCQQCHEPIALDRLEAAPDTNVCFWCANR